MSPTRTYRVGRSRPLARAGIAAVSALWLFASPEPAHAATNPSAVESAWWNLAAPGPVAPPAPTTGSDIQVGDGVNGPLSYAAVRFQVPDGLEPQSTSVVLHLNLAQTGNLGTPAVAACVTTGSWTAGGDQPSASAPGYDCGSGKTALGFLSGSSEEWILGPTFLKAATQGIYDIALVPAPGSSTPFSVDYAQPTRTSVEFTGSLSPAPSSPPVTPPDTRLPTQPAPGASFPAIGPASVPPLLQPPPVVTATAPPTPSVLAPGSMPGGGRPTITAAAPANIQNRTAKTMAAAVLLALGSALYLLGRRPTRAPRLIGVFADTSPVASAPLQMRGIGRFAKARTAPPPRLS